MKKKKKHKASIMHEKDGRCYLCMLLNDDFRFHNNLHDHHIFGGSNRPVSEAEGLKVWLCPEHHTIGAAAVHLNHENMLLLRREGQRVYEETHSREEFMKKFGRNYLE